METINIVCSQYFSFNFHRTWWGKFKPIKWLELSRRTSALGRISVGELRACLVCLVGGESSTIALTAINHEGASAGLRGWRCDSKQSHHASEMKYTDKHRSSRLQLPLRRKKNPLPLLKKNSELITQNSRNSNCEQSFKNQGYFMLHSKSCNS